MTSKNNPTGPFPAMPAATDDELAKLLGRPSVLSDARNGCVVWWSCANGAQALPDDLRRHLEPLGTLVRDKVRSETKAPVQAMRKAIRRRQSSRATRKRQQFWRELDCTDETLTISNAAEHLNGSYSADETFKVQVDVKTGDLSVDKDPTTQEGHDRLASLTAAYRKERGYLAADDMTGALSKILVDVVGAACVKQGGSVYFVPKHKDDMLLPLAVALARANVGLKLIVMEANPTIAGQYVDEVHEGLLAKVEKLRERCLERLSAADDWAAGRTKHDPYKSIAARIDEADELRREAAMFRRWLGLATKDLDMAIDACEQITSKALNRKRPDRLVID